MNKEIIRAVNLIVNHCKEHYKNNKDCSGCIFKRIYCENPCDYIRSDNIYCYHEKEKQAVKILGERFKDDYYCYACEFFYLYNCGKAPKDWIKERKVKQ